MGIFDDAIREHLELKRHSGADEDELKELEDEAFGLPARPGEEDFPGTSEEAAVESETGAPAGVFDAETSETETPSDAVIEAPSEEEPALTPIDDAAMPQTDQPPEDPVSEAPAVGKPSEEESAPVDAPTPVDEPDVQEPIEEPAPADPGDASSFTTAEREAIADQPTVFFEQQEPAELELGDLELDIDEEVEEVGGAVSDPLPDEDPLIVEEAFTDREVAEPPHQVEPEPEPAGPDEPEAEAAEPGTSDEDVLEETPEFLRDNPDDDELWFEQGEPKDFDF